MKVYLYTDGSAKLSRETWGVKTGRGKRGHSGPGSWSYVIRDTDNKILEIGGDTLEDTTVPEAELSAIIGGLAACQRLGATEVVVHCDSQLVVNQANGVWAVRAKHLVDYYDEIKEMSKTFKTVTIEWVPREENHLADQVGREIVKEAVNVNSN